MSVVYAVAGGGSFLWISGGSDSELFEILNRAMKRRRGRLVKSRARNMDVETPRGRHTKMNVLVEMSGDQEGEVRRTIERNYNPHQECRQSHSEWEDKE